MNLDDEIRKEENREKQYRFYLDKMNRMVEDDRYHFAYETIDSIMMWVVKNKRITPKQINAIENIQDGVNR